MNEGRKVEVGRVKVDKYVRVVRCLTDGEYRLYEQMIAKYMVDGRHRFEFSH